MLLGGASRLIVRTFLLVACVAVLLYPATRAAAQSGLTQLRSAPIADGESVGVLHLGDTEGAVITALGGPPTTIEELPNGARRDLVYAVDDPSSDSQLTVRISFTIGSTRSEAIHLVMARRITGAAAQTGTTTRGYVSGQSDDHLRSSYGFPDLRIATDVPDRFLAWYREVGLIVEPGEWFDGEWYRTRVIVVNPYLAGDDVARLISGY